MANKPRHCILGCYVLAAEICWSNHITVDGAHNKQQWGAEAAGHLVPKVHNDDVIIIGHKGGAPQRRERGIMLITIRLLSLDGWPPTRERTKGPKSLEYWQACVAAAAASFSMAKRLNLAAGITPLVHISHGEWMYLVSLGNWLCPSLSIPPQYEDSHTDLLYRVVAAAAMKECIQCALNTLRLQPYTPEIPSYGLGPTSESQPNFWCITKLTKNTKNIEFTWKTIFSSRENRLSPGWTEMKPHGYVYSWAGKCVSIHFVGQAEGNATPSRWSWSYGCRSQEGSPSLADKDAIES